MKTEIKTIKDVQEFASHLVKRDKLSFHPDDDFETYSVKENDVITSFYTKDEAILRNKLMDSCFDICEKHNMDIYEIMFQVMNKEYNNRFIQFEQH